MINGSTRVGLVVAGGLVLGALTLSWPQFSGRANAAGPISGITIPAARSGFVPQAETHLKEVEGSLNGPTALAHGSCNAETENWFAPEFHPIRPCGGIDMPPSWVTSTEAIIQADVNHDGNREFFTRGSAEVISSGTPTRSQECLFIQSRMVENVGEMVETGVCVAPCPSSLGASLLALYPELGGATSVWVIGAAWRDVDLDGDEDLLVYVQGNLNQDWPVQRVGWLRNVGFEAAPQANPYDLDHDGEVSAADISVLLLHFGD